MLVESLGTCTSGSSLPPYLTHMLHVGVQEILTDPSYKGQIVAFTHVHIGNTGINFGACVASPRGPTRCVVASRCHTSLASIPPVDTMRTVLVGLLLGFASC